MTKLSDLLKALPREVVHITADSRTVQKGSLYVAITGASSDGHDFIHEAAANGAVLIVAEKPMPQALTVPVITVKNSREALARLAAQFYRHPSDSMKVIGITGTSGKTTTTYVLESIFKAAGHQVGVLGTISFRFNGQEIPATHTTPDAVELQRLLAQMKAQGCTAVIMEVSSHALKQFRVGGVHFDAVAFLNLSPEHLDFHPDMEDYFNTKKQLFTSYALDSETTGKTPLKVINCDDPWGLKLFNQLQAEGAAHLHPYSLHQRGPGPEPLSISLEGIAGSLFGIRIQSSLSGSFNASNIAAAVALGHGLGLSSEAIQTGISNLKAVPGRLERIPNSKGVHVFVDYAHKPDALEKVLNTLRHSLECAKTCGRLITVFGCGGDRDRTKRPVMGRLAVTLSDQVWITSDNPRTEAPEAIIHEITVGTAGHLNFQIESDRKRAIEGALAEAQAGDVVLIAGKGHEDYQIIGTEKIHFDDREVVRLFLEL